MNSALQKRLAAAESKAATVHHSGGKRIVSGGCYTQEELDLIHEATGPSEPCLNPSEIVIIFVDTEKREPRPLEELLRLYAIKTPMGG